MWQEAVNVTTEIQEELFLKMGVGDLRLDLPLYLLMNWVKVSVYNLISTFLHMIKLVFFCLFGVG